MKIISWNVNGIRAVLKKGFREFLETERPEIFCLQEIKISDAAKTEAAFDFPGYREYWNSALRPGYSGTATLVREDIDPPLSISGLGLKEFDDEGRTQILEFADFYLVNCYFPNANAELSRLAYKLVFNEALQKKLKELELKKPVILTGDYNVAHREIDLARPKENIGSAGFTYEERAWLDRFLAVGFIDTYRALNGNRIQYTWWSYRAYARARNIGWRIDYFCVSEKFLPKIKTAAILDEVEGSDHCPILIVL